MAAFLDVCRFTPTAGGTTDWTYSAAVLGYQSPAAAGAVTSAVYRYRAESADLSQWEVGHGAYSGGVLSRTTVLYNSSGSTSKINFSTVPQVAIVALAEDLVNLVPAQGRLTLTSATPVISSGVAGATTVYWTPFGGNIIPIYDGANFIATPFAELSQLTTDATKSPAAVAASKIYDLFVWNDAGTLRCTRGPAWTNATTRGYTMTATNGVQLNTSSITNGPAALRGTWVGTIASNGSSTIDYIFGATGSGGVAAVLNVWNTYNRVNVAAKVIDNASFTNSSNSITSWHNGAGTMRVDFVLGSQTDAVTISYGTEASLIAASSAIAVAGIGYDSTSAFAEVRNRVTYPLTIQAIVGSGIWSPAVGTHTVSMLQQSDGTNLNQFNNTAGATLNVALWM